MKTLIRALVALISLLSQISCTYLVYLAITHELKFIGIIYSFFCFKWITKLFK